MSQQNSTPASRRAAYTVIFIWMIAAGLAASFTVAGRLETGLLMCGGGIVISLIVIGIGSAVVASSKED